MAVETSQKIQYRKRHLFSDPLELTLHSDAAYFGALILFEQTLCAVMNDC